MRGDYLQRLSPVVRYYAVQNGSGCWGRRRFAHVASTWHFEEKDWRQRLSSARLLYFGERHDQAAVRDAQIEVLREFAQGAPTALVLEMFTLPQQSLLDNYARMTKNDVEDHYCTTGGDFDLEHYLPLIDAALATDVTVFAGFPTRAAAREICTLQPGAPQLQELAELHASLGVAGAADHFRLFAGMISAADLRTLDHEGELPERGRQIFAAQCWKDLVCAQVIQAALEQYQRVMLVAGCGHTDYGLGVPQRVAALVNAVGARRGGGLRPVEGVTISAREIGEDVVRAFRGRPLADLLVRYIASEPPWASQLG